MRGLRVPSLTESPLVQTAARKTRRGLPTFGERVLLAGAYWLTGYVALLLAIPPGYASPVWPAAGIAFAFVYVHGYRLWPSIFAASFCVNLATSWDPGSTGVMQSAMVAASIGLAASAQAVVGALLVNRYIGNRCSLTDGAETWRFLALAGPLSCLIGATCGTGTLVLAGFIAGADFGYSWWTWWTGDTIGVLIAAPITLACIGKPRAIWQNRRWTVGLSLGLSLLAIAAAFAFASNREEQRLQLAFEHRANAAIVAIESSLVKYEEILQSIRSFYAGTESVTRHDFRRFVSRTLSRVPGIQALSWNPLISHASNRNRPAEVHYGRGPTLPPTRLAWRRYIQPATAASQGRPHLSSSFKKPARRRAR